MAGRVVWISYYSAEISLGLVSPSCVPHDVFLSPTVSLSPCLVLFSVSLVCYHSEGETLGKYVVPGEAATLLVPCISAFSSFPHHPHVSFVLDYWTDVSSSYWTNCSYVQKPDLPHLPQTPTCSLTEESLLGHPALQVGYGGRHRVGPGGWVGCPAPRLPRRVVSLGRGSENEREDETESRHRDSDLGTCHCHRQHRGHCLAWT
uniref:Uncharacterized protein n=1 Tax=Cacopsylla melanoneura TaxID=428564 RepID=A0A8D8PTN8_9HEMI